MAGFGDIVYSCFVDEISLSVGLRLSFGNIDVGKREMRSASIVCVWRAGTQTGRPGDGAVGGIGRNLLAFNASLVGGQE